MKILQHATKFDAVDDRIYLSRGAVPQIFGGVTFAAVVYISGVTTYRTLISVDEAGGNNEWAFGINGSVSKWMSLITASSSTAPTSTITANRPYLVGHAKASGSVATRFHWLDLFSGQWYHENGNAQADNPAGGSQVFRIGTYRGTSNPWSNLVAFLATFPFVMTDAQFELLAQGLHMWHQFRPTMLVSLLGPRAVDLTGRGAEETSRVGTQVGMPFLSPYPFSYPSRSIYPTVAASSGNVMEWNQVQESALIWPWGLAVESVHGQRVETGIEQPWSSGETTYYGQTVQSNPVKPWSSSGAAPPTSETDANVKISEAEMGPEWKIGMFD